MQQPLTRAKKQIGFLFWYQLLISKLHFVLRDKKVVLIPKLLLARERYAQCFGVRNTLNF